MTRLTWIALATLAFVEPPPATDPGAVSPPAAERPAPAPEKQTASGPSGALRARFIGNAAFEITDGKATLLTDFPYVSGAFGYMKFRFEDVQPVGKVLCLISHTHEDHWNATLFKKTNWSLAAPVKLVRNLDASRIVPFASKMEFEGMEIRPVQTPHPVEAPSQGGWHYSYRVDWHGVSLHFTGDTEIASGALDAGPLDVLFITPWLLADVLKQRRDPPFGKIVVYHHLPGEEIAKCRQCVVPAQGDVIEIPFVDNPPPPR